MDAQQEKLALKPRKLIGLRPLVHGALQLVDPLVRFFVPEDLCVVDDEPLTLVVPLHEKDLLMAGEAIRFALENLRHPLDEVVVISAESEKVSLFCEEKDARWLNEEEVLPVSSGEVKARLAQYGYENWGWVYQQLLKLNVDAVIPAKNYLILDADTVLLRPIQFKRKGVLYQQFSHERNPYYTQSYGRLLGQGMRGKFSYVCHYMFAEAQILSELRSEIEAECGKPWYDAIMDQANPELWPAGVTDQVPFNFFSEYETYGNFCRRYYDDVKCRYFFNRSASDYSASKESIDEYVKRMPRIYQWASFHHYLYE